MSAYDAIAGLYDPWSSSVVEDISFYVDEALASGGPVVELGVGTGRIAIPTAMAGVDVIGVDSSAGMLAVCRQRADEAGLGGRLDLRLGDLRTPPVEPPVARKHLEARLREQRVPARGLEPPQRHRRLAARAADGESQRLRVEIPVGALVDAGLALDPAAVRLLDVAA